MRQMAKDIATYIRMFVDDSSSELNKYILEGKINNEFIRGNQRKKVNQNSKSIEDTASDPNVYTEKKVFNRLFPIYLTRYSLLSQNMPIPGIIPYGYTSKDVNDARNVNSFLKEFMESISFKEQYQKIIKQTDVYAGCWVKTGLDWTEGDEIAEVPIETSDGMKGKMTLREGRPFLCVAPIYEVFVDTYYAESIDEVNELVHRRVFPVDYIKKRWGFDAKKESINDAKLSTYPRYSNFGLSNGGAIDYAYIYEYYKKPDAIYPKGRYVIVCNDQVLYDDVLPYKNASGERRVIPFDFLTFQSVPNMLFGPSVYSQLRPIQQTYNAVKNRYLEYVNHIAIGQLYYWEGSLINKNNFTNKPGKLIGLKRNSKPPQPVTKDKLSQEFMSYLKSLEDDMLITAGLSQIAAFGTAKSSVRTDGVVDKISESDDNKLGNAIDNGCKFLVSIFKKILYLEKEREETLKAQLHVANRDDYVIKYKLGEVNAEQLTIVNREFLMKNDQVFDKKLQQAGNLGLYNPQANISFISKLEFLDALQANYLKDTLDPMQRATHDLVEEEHMRLLNENVVPTAEKYHIHQQHIEEHELFRISPEVRCLQTSDPNKYAKVLEAIESHIEQHKKMMDQNQKGNVFADAKDALRGTARK